MGMSGLDLWEQIELAYKAGYGGSDDRDELDVREKAWEKYRANLAKTLMGKTPSLNKTRAAHGIGPVLGANTITQDVGGGYRQVLPGGHAIRAEDVEADSAERQSEYRFQNWAFTVLKKRRETTNMVRANPDKYPHHQRANRCCSVCFGSGADPEEPLGPCVCIPGPY
jgi:hypothetical protein